MSRFRPANNGQLFLIPSEPGFWLPTDHPARLFNDFVENELDLSKFLVSRKTGGRRGRPPYDPVMLVKLQLYGYSVGITSGRDIEAACVERIDFRYLAGGCLPSCRKINDFRSSHLEDLAGLFGQVLSAAIEEGMVEMEDHAFDGTKVLANASKRKAMSYERMNLELQKLTQEVKDLMEQRKASTNAKRKQLRIELDIRRAKQVKVQTAKIELEERCMNELGKLPEPKDQLNFTDPESRIMKKGAGFEQCYNAQAAVDKANQIIVAAFVTQAGNDKQMLKPLVSNSLDNLGLLPDRALADAGYFSETVAEDLSSKYKSTKWFIVPDRLKHGEQAMTPIGRIPKNISVADRMRRVLSTKAGKAAYAQRKTIVEPVFGQIKEANLEFRRFSMRGLKNADLEWSLVCAVHNLAKIVRWRRRSLSAQAIQQKSSQIKAA